jgi:hypothetical protein
MTTVNYQLTPKTFKRETNDCFVRALMTSANLQYTEAHKMAATLFSRKYGKGTFGVPVVMTAEKTQTAFQNLGLTATKEDNTYTRSWDKTGRKLPMTIAVFIKKNPRGSFLILVRGHALAIVDGVIHDWPNAAQRTNRKILHVFQIRNNRQLELFA